MSERNKFEPGDIAIGVGIIMVVSVIAPCERKSESTQKVVASKPAAPLTDNTVDDALRDVRKRIALEHNSDPDPRLNAATQQFCEELEAKDDIRIEPAGTKMTLSANKSAEDFGVFRKAILTTLANGDTVILDCTWEQPKTDKNQRQERCVDGKCKKFTGMRAIQRSEHRDIHFNDDSFAPDHSFHGVDGNLDRVSTENLPSTKNSFKHWDKENKSEQPRFRQQFKDLVDLGRGSLQNKTYRPISIKDQNREYARRGGR